MSNAEARQSGAMKNPPAFAAEWAASDVARADVGRYPRFADHGRPDLPDIVADLGAGEIAARIAAWRAGNRQFDALFRESVPPAQALRRLALTHWSSGDPRQASAILATAAAISPADAVLWQELGSTLQAIGDRSGARDAFEWSVALEPGSARAWLGLGLVANELSDERRAEEAFAAAFERDPNLSEAGFGLGLVCFEQRRYAEAAGHWRAAIAAGCANPQVCLGLGQCLFFLGEFAAAASAFAPYVGSGAADANIVRRFALTRFLETAISATAEAAHEAYRSAAGADAEAPAMVSRAAFQILSAYGHREAALRIGRVSLSGDGDDPVQRYLLDAVTGEGHDRAPRDYLVRYFDQFAESFDRQLVEVLGYRVPEQLVAMIAATGSPLSRVLDLGCGTGLAGPLLRAGRTRLVGVDLSPRMLDKSAARGCYDALVEADMVTFLEQTSERFDLVFAADALIYLGDLHGFLAAAGRVATAGGMLAFNVETTTRADYALLPSGRFAHRVEALLASAAPWFELEANQPAFLRNEANRKVNGALLLLRRRADPGLGG